MVRLRTLIVAILLCAVTTASAQGDRTGEYQLKAAYLYNFVKFVEWPPRAASGPISICIAGRTPMTAALAETIRGESVAGRPLVARAINEPEPGCSVLFVAESVAAAPYLRAVRGMPTLTVGESSDFLSQGGMINFVLEGGKIRFEVDVDAPERAELHISSRMLRLARNLGPRGTP